MSKRRIIPLIALLMLVCALPVAAQRSFGNGMLRIKKVLRLTGDSDRDRDGLTGPVRRIRTETAKLSNKNGKPVEGARVALEVAAYDIKGNKTENAYYPVPGAALTGKEVYKYDEKGNIVEMTLLNADGSLASKEIYTYEFDFAGNWTKMTTSVAVIENGKLSFEPTEVTYRTISYYLDDNIAKMMQAAQTAAATPAAPTAVASSSPATNAVASTATAPANPNAKTEMAVSKPAATDSAKPASTLPAASIVKTSVSVTDKQSAPASSAPKNDVASNKPAKNEKESSTPAEKNENAKSGQAGKAEAEQPTQPVAKPPVRPVSGGVLNGKATSLPIPDYPASARSARASGVVVVEVVIDVSGKVISARAVSGPALLQQAAVQAAYRARFSPTMLSGQAVKVSGTINYNFALAK